MLPSYVMLHLSYLICNASVYLISIFLYIYLYLYLISISFCGESAGCHPWQGLAAAALAATVIRTGT